MPALAAYSREKCVWCVPGMMGKREREWMSSAKSSLLLILGHVRSILKQFIFICCLVYKKQH